ncbi:MAG TPA: cysteine desulfurase NifS [Hungateiclostridium thermocellum]|jgi:cysteine desulfurase|uniref:Cysteine desulfurase IscS n=2 Tax=Acetivibrio thermocellus TaxID=1515 RepID=A3DDC6_ACET2|nr:cysteine desulfurase NifS [Acetivibrio thermocellus]CDG35413.1 Cysteine desulfurase [Acetivibrio thermocellus BC1]ABN51955.1 cysteine desulfurase NifS [Acetivibrio thermocellus ATCC 27405]ADU74565.1 cysteine desulfurase NifS [Acetivibrio thermocellus DSM 1313]ALX08509.1 Cysteine desulfurase [Acetivibrio thermocellus AD2]ANV76258.1 Cysteine desulfurase [Acetivibrio thermocellus DSM 2360]
MSDNRFVYLDHAATTPVKPEVLEAMLPYFSNKFGNASSIYSIGRESKKAIEEAREKVAKAIGALPREVFFTGSGTEADNWAIKGVAYANRDKGRHIITTAIEHHAVLHACQYLESDGFEVTYLPVDENGLVSPQQVQDAIRPDTILITIMFANNEIGTIQPIAEIGKIARERGVIFHTDAVQAVGNIPINVVDLNVDLLSMSGHKFYGPKGVGALYIRKGVKIVSFMHGGAQERGRRASTENVAGIVGMGKAIELAVENMEENNKKLIELRDRTIEEVMKKIPFVRLNGDRYKRLPGNVNFSFEFIEGESLLLMLDMKGIAASSGSACTSGSLDPSHVLLAIGLPHEIAHGSLRLTFGIENTHEDIDYLMEVLPTIVDRLREMSPLYEKVKRGN